jgi:hypothetical protein
MSPSIRPADLCEARVGPNRGAAESFAATQCTIAGFRNEFAVFTMARKLHSGGGQRRE